MNYQFRATEQFWRSFYELSSAQKDSVREAWKFFKSDPFHPSLGVHKIHNLSARYKKTIYSAVIESDLRVVFLIEGNLVISLDVGTHDVYR